MSAPVLLQKLICSHVLNVRKLRFFFSLYSKTEKDLHLATKTSFFFASFVQERNRAVKLLKQFDPVPQFQFDDEGLKSKMRWFRGG